MNFSVQDLRIAILRIQKLAAANLMHLRLPIFMSNDLIFID
jgi:hypothetical protein